MSTVSMRGKVVANLKVCMSRHSLNTLEKKKRKVVVQTNKKKKEKQQAVVHIAKNFKK